MMKRRKIQKISNNGYTLFLSGLVLFFCVLVLVPVSAQDFETPDKPIGLLYLEEAYTLYQNGNTGENSGFLSLLETALEFFPEQPDAFYMMGDVRSRNRGGIYTALELLRRAAVKEDGWYYFSPYDCRVVEAGLLLRVGRSEEGLQLLDSIRKEDYHRYEYYLYRALILEALKRNFDAELTLRRGLDFHPEEVELKKLLVEISPDYRSEIAAQFYDERLQPEGAEHLDLLEAVIIHIADGEKRQNLLDIYKGAADTLTAELAAYNLFYSEELDPNSFFRTYERIKISTILYIYRNLMEKEPEQVDFDPLKDYTGTVILDENRDGFFEESLEYRSGRVVKYLVDRNQDGLPEYHILFDESGLPNRVSGENLDRRALFVFSKYPQVKEVTIENAQGIKVYTIIPGDFTYPFFRIQTEKETDYPPRLLIGEINKSLSPVSEELLRRRSTVIVERSSAGEKVRWDRLENDVWQKTFYLPGGGSGTTMVVGREEVHTLIDSDADGKKETSLVYEDGKKVRKEIDANHNGVPEFILILEDTIAQWDINEDGIVDSREYEGEEGNLIREYASNFDGVFDTKIVWKNRKIISVVRKGETLPVYRDPDYSGLRGNVYWIGTMPTGPMDIENIPTEGIVHKNGTLLYVFSVYGNTYIEVLH